MHQVRYGIYEEAAALHPGIYEKNPLEGPTSGLPVAPARRFGRNLPGLPEELV